jgi:hypothetical protein
MRVVTVAGAASISGRGGSMTGRLSVTWKGISAPAEPSRFTRLILPPAQKTMLFESGVHAMFG